MLQRSRVKPCHALATLLSPLVPMVRIPWQASQIAATSEQGRTQGWWRSAKASKQLTCTRFRLAQEHFIPTGQLVALLRLGLRDSPALILDFVHIGHVCIDQSMFFELLWKMPFPTCPDSATPTF